MLRLTNYKKAYGSSPVLAITQLQLPAGIYWLKGQNGAGKTTLLKSIAGIIPFEGQVSVDSIDLRKQRMLYTRSVAFAEAEPLYPGFLTGNDLLRLYEETKGKNELTIKKIITDLGLHTYLSNKVSTYSSGMLKKLSLLLAFTGNPKLILLDEPFITLDIAAVDVLQQLVAESFANGISFLISSHQALDVTIPYTTLVFHQQTVQLQDAVAAE